MAHLLRTHRSETVLHMHVLYSRHFNSQMYIELYLTNIFQYNSYKLDSVEVSYVIQLGTDLHNQSRARAVTKPVSGPDYLPASEPASLKTSSTDPQITLLSPSPSTTPTLKGVLFLTDSVLKHTPESFLSNVCGSGLRCTKKVNYRLTQVFGYNSEFPHFGYVIIACGVNDLARYDHTPQSLAASVIPRLRETCSRYKTTIFLYSAIIETKHGWLNSWISEFNTAMFEVAAQTPNLFFFDAQNVLEKDPITHSNFGRNVFRDDIHITDKARRVIANELVSGIRLLVNLDLERFDQARIQLKSWDWPLRSAFLERRRSFLSEFFGAIPSF